MKINIDKPKVDLLAGSDGWTFSNELDDDRLIVHEEANGDIVMSGWRLTTASIVTLRKASGRMTWLYLDAADKVYRHDYVCAGPVR